MSYQNISGLDLFQTPFHRPQASSQQANRQKQNDTNLQPKPAAATAQAGKARTQAEPASKQDARGKSDTQPKAGSTGPKAPDVQPKAADSGQGVHITQPKPFEIQPTTPVLGDVSAPKPSPTQGQAATSAEPMAHVDTPVQKKELVLDMSAGTTACSPLKASDQEKRKADHEAAEAKRKAEEAELQKLQDMTDEEAVAASTRRISEDVERITRRNMKECVAEYIQELCRKDPAFARLTMNRRKSMAGCFSFINRQARDYVKQEMADNDIKPENGGYGCDVPDGIVYQWAEDYFNNPDAPEDKIKEEKFVPKPYVSTAPKSKKASDKNKKAEKPDKKKPKDKQEQPENYEQMTLGV